MATANNGLPARDTSFTGSLISIAGIPFEKGLGTYPVSEIVYDLDQAYSAFEAKVGVDDEASDDTGGVEFIVFVDDLLLYKSGAIRPRESALEVSLNVSGGRSLRLAVVSADGGHSLSYADWADARLLPETDSEFDFVDGGLVEMIRNDLQIRKAYRELEYEAREGIASKLHTVWDELLTTQGYEPSASDTEVHAGFDAGRGLLLLGNNRLAISLSYGGVHNGQLSLLDLQSDILLINDAAPVMRPSSGADIPLRDNSIPNGYRLYDVADPVFGRGKAVEASFALPGIGSEARTHLTLFDGAPYILYQIDLANETTGDRTTKNGDLVHFSFFSKETGQFQLGDDVEYITDFSRIRTGKVRDDGVLRREAIGLGKPILVRDRSARRGLVMALIDETRTVPEFEIVTDPRRIVSRISLTGSSLAHTTSPSAPASASSSRLYLEVVPSDNLSDAFVNFRNIMGSLYPALPLPDWVKYQWLSWYVYYMDINEDVIKRQIDYIAENLLDLGPWNILIDAGWYVAEGREGSDWRNVDRDKFPSGLPALVDYAHTKGLKTVLYFSSPYLDSREQYGDWLGLKGLINEHRDWLVLLGGDETRESFAYDFDNSGLRAYMREVFSDFFTKYNVDGIKIDGLGNAEGAILYRERLNTFGSVDEVTGQTMNIYRFIYQNADSLKKDVYVESGWLTPLFANPFAHTFRYGDERDSFFGRYPFPGLVEHVDYAAFQKVALGQRPNMGAIHGDPNLSIVNKWWLQAGLALGSQVVLSFDLPEMTADTLGEYRALLAHYNAFQGHTTFGENFETRGESFGPNTFATVVGPLAYVGAINRESADKLVTLKLEDLGVGEGQDYVALDVANKQYSRTSGAIRTLLPAESFRLFIVRKSPGIVWTNGSIDEQSDVERSDGRSSLAFSVTGPRMLDGFVEVFVPSPTSVKIDGRELAAATGKLTNQDEYYYDTMSGVLRLEYSHEAPHSIVVTY